MVEVTAFFTRLMYQAHIEVHKIITATDATVINKVQPNASKNQVFLIPFI